MIMLSLIQVWQADASKFLVENKVNSVAIDSPSIDVGTDNNNFISNRCFGDRESL